MHVHYKGNLYNNALYISGQSRETNGPEQKKLLLFRLLEDIKVYQ